MVKRIQITTWIDSDIHKEAKIKAAIEDIKLYELIEQAIQEYLNKGDNNVEMQQMNMSDGPNNGSPNIKLED